MTYSRFRIFHVLLVAVSVVSPARAQEAPGNAPAPDMAPRGLPGCGTGVPPIEYPDPPPPERKQFAVSPGQVDMRTGAFVLEHADVGIGGSGDDALSLVRSFSYASGTDTPRQWMGDFFTHNWNVELREIRSAPYGACYIPDFDYDVTIKYGSLGESFHSASSPIQFKQVAPAGYAELNLSSGSYTFTARDGTVVVFLSMSAATNYCGGWSSTYRPERCTVASSITRPDGTVYTFGYDNFPDAYSRRLRSVTSNRGYALLFEYGGNGLAVTKACALNLAEAPVPASGACPAGALSATYSYSGTVQTAAVEAGGGTWYFTQPASGTFGIRRPGEATPYVVNSYALVGGPLNRPKALAVTSQAFSTGETYDYEWDEIVNGNSATGQSIVNAGGQWTDGNGKSVKVEYGKYRKYDPNNLYNNIMLYPTPGPEDITDQLGRNTHYDYCGTLVDGNICGIPPLQSVTYPEGNREEFQYTTYRNISAITGLSKPGSGLSDIGETRAYACSAAVCRSKPTSITDPNGNTTNWTYAAAHGGVLTEMKPAPASGGARPLTVHTYVQKYAYIKNSGGTLVAASSPVWVPATMTECQTAAGSSTPVCDSGAPQRLTTYEYGADGTANNLLVRGVAVSGGGMTLRTCYGYDGLGRKISETKPNADLSVCP